jgi:hypothetical protein
MNEISTFWLNSESRTHLQTQTRLLLPKVSTWMPFSFFTLPVFFQRIDNDLRHCEKLLLLHFPRDDLYGSWSAVVHLSIIYLQSIFVTKYTEARERTRFHVQSIYIGERHEISRHDIDFLVGERDWNDNCCII